jgi:hypothetical protein
MLYKPNEKPRNTTRRGSLGTVDLLVKLSCFVKWSIMFPILKADDLS